MRATAGSPSRSAGTRNHHQRLHVIHHQKATRRATTPCGQQAAARSAAAAWRCGVADRPQTLCLAATTCCMRSDQPHYGPLALANEKDAVSVRGKPAHRTEQANQRAFLKYGKQINVLAMDRRVSQLTKHLTKHLLQLSNAASGTPRSMGSLLTEARSPLRWHARCWLRIGADVTKVESPGTWYINRPYWPRQRLPGLIMLSCFSLVS